MSNILNEHLVSNLQHNIFKGPSGSMSQVVGLSNNSYKPITNTVWVRARFCILQKGCTRLAAASDKVYQLFTHGRWFSPGTPISSITKTGRHEIAEILLKVALNTKNHKSNHCDYEMYNSNKSTLPHVHLHPYPYFYQRLSGLSLCRSPFILL